MRAFGTDMTGHAMVQRIRSNGLQAGGGGTADEPIQDHRNTRHARPQDRPGHRRDLAPAQGSQQVQTVAAAMARDTRRHDLGLARQTRIVHAGAAPGPILGLPAIQRMGQRRRGGGVADPHLAGDQQVRVFVDRAPARRQGRQQIVLAHRRAFGEITRGAVQIERDHIHPCAKRLGQLVDRRAAGFEIGHHLHRHLGRKGRHAARRNAMIARKDHHLGCRDPRPSVAAPARIPGREVLQPAKRRGGLGQLAVAVGRIGNRPCIGPRQGAQDMAVFGKSGRSLGHVIPR